MSFCGRDKNNALEALENIRNKYLEKDNEKFINKLYKNAIIYWKDKNLDFAEVFLTEIINELKNEDTLLKANVMHILASLYCLINKCTEARPLIIKAIEVKELLNLKYNKTTINSLLVLGGIENKSVNFQDSFSACNKAYEIALNINEMVEVSMLSIGELYIRTQQYEKAEMLMIEALNISLNNKNENMIGHCLDTLGYLYLETENHDEAHKKFETSLQIIEKNGDVLKKRHYPTLLHRRAALYIKTGQYSQAKTLLLESLKIKKRYNKLSIPY